MAEQYHSGKKILIVDDSEVNRTILRGVLENEFQIIEAENGEEAIKMIDTYRDEIALILLDYLMPVMNGIGVLEYMNEKYLIEKIPVIMITSEARADFVEKVYKLGVTDFVNRPFNTQIIHHRVVNTIMLYTKQKNLEGMVERQICEKEQQSDLMIDILSHIVEFRNGESGLHVLHIRTLTELLLRHLVKKTSQYKLSSTDINLISTASALHDIGKIVIPEQILNKPGKLTADEFVLMKPHAAKGAEMLDSVYERGRESLLDYAREICRWHHERYDGRGYPDGLAGEEIPICAQVTALADVYDALTSERVYKKAYTHETAVRMILDGECGAFNPILLECLKEIEGSIREALRISAEQYIDTRQVRDMTNELICY